jgi:glutathione S-transferase/RNA polymerase-associated protein
MLKLYEHPLSPYVQKVKIALYEKEIPFETQMPNAFTGGPTDYSRLNPRLEVPTLADGDLNIFDSTTILQYIEDKWPKPPMLPDSPADRARVRMIEELCDTYYEAINWGMMEIRLFKRASGELADGIIKRANEQIAGVHAWLERQLDGREFFNGNSFGYGDLSVFPFVNTSVFFGTQPAAGSRLAKWYAATAQRPSAVKCSGAANQSAGAVEQLPQLIESGAFVRQYRDHRLEWMMRSGGSDIVLAGMEKRNIRFSSEVS